MEQEIRKKEMVFKQQDYGKQTTFASFLPGIAGIRGIPIWCYYVNRGQAVVSFGVENKDHAIMEFYPAHQAYQNVKRTGFRTFYRIDGVYGEAFSDEDTEQMMSIGQNDLAIKEVDKERNLQTKVLYFGLPGEQIGALVRKVEMKNLSQKEVHLEVLDGMPALIPYGVDNEGMKNMGQTSKAWMQVEDVETGIPYFRVRASMGDTASVQKIEGGNFSYACLENGEKLPVIADPDLVFSYDTSLEKAVGLKEKSVKELLGEKQKKQNQLPCSFAAVDCLLESGESIVFYEIIGQVQKKELLEEFFAEEKNGSYFEAKLEEARELVEDICKGIRTKTGSKEFDAYSQYTYMDNVLRGGLPMQLGNNKIFYVYSRKHGDLERDYNYFSMLPEFYSQGNGNFRDVNQNRRCDTFFAPFVGRENIHTFYGLIQLDGYNPLGVEKITYQMKENVAEEVLAEIGKEEKDAIKEVVTKPYTPGTLYRRLEEILKEDWKESLFTRLIDFSESLVNGNFGEGYWCDHWTYLLDLVEDYLEVFPEKEAEMLYEENYSYFLSQINVNPRKKRYVETPQGLRQYKALDETTKRQTEEKLVRSEYGEGEIYYGTLLEKLLLLCATKFSTLDAYGMGIEMEGGKPGWYDALNGMPGIFGSSMAETYELARMLDYTIGALKRHPGEVKVLTELGCFLDELNLINRIEQKEILEKEEVLSFWNRINDAKEIYRDKTFYGISGKKSSYRSEQLVEMLEGWRDTVETGIKKACCRGDGICPTYFTYEATDYEVCSDGIRVKQFEVQQVPDFLEGQVRYLKLQRNHEEKKALYEAVKSSELYDKKLQMYRVNASLQNASYELGRARAFTPGWLENESIWLHMEYKYLLELLRSGLYEEFLADFHKAAVPFLDAKTYGRSILENSSFLASSKNPDESIHGKGFVARLSGSTIEFISMWKLMMFGKHIFYSENQELIFAPQPLLPQYLIPEDGIIEATLLGKTKVRYIVSEVQDYIPGTYEIRKMKFYYEKGGVAELAKPEARGKLAEEIRSGAITEIEISLE